MEYLASLAKATGFASPSSKPHGDLQVKSTTNTKSSIKRNRGVVNSTEPSAKSLKEFLSVDDAPLRTVKAAKISKPSHDRKKKRYSSWSIPIISSFFGNGSTAESDSLEVDTVVGSDDLAPRTDNDSDLTLVADDGEYEAKDRHEKANRSLKDYRTEQRFDDEDPRIREWSDAETWLYAKLRRRSREPLFDITWVMDFPFFPDRLFTRDPEKVIITNINLTIYRAVKAFHDLCKTAALVRGQITSGAIPERPLVREINNFYKWTLADGKLEHKAHIPVTAIACARPGEATESVVNRVTDQIHDLGRQYRDKWRHPDCSEDDPQQVYTHPLPTLVGFVIKYTVVAIVSCDASVPNKPIRTLITTDWKVKGQDVWHAIAVSIAFIMQRNYLMQLDAEGELGPEIIDRGDDPDA